METVGVQAVVEGLLSYMSDMDKVQGKIDDLGSSGSILGNIFDSVTGVIGSFGREVLNVAEVALGVMLRDALEGVISAIGELIGKTIEAGNEFQTLTLRLQGMNLQTAIDSGMNYQDAMQEAASATEETLDWLQLLAMTTPFDNTDISEVYTMGRTYNFTDEQMRTLTEDIADFTAGMGKGQDVMKAVMLNFGQMASRGKITGREITDLSKRGVPLRNILERIGKVTGNTAEEVQKLISTPGAGVPFELFINAFQEMVNEEERFNGASARMARTFGAAFNNVMDIITSFGGKNIAMPILDVLGGKIADFMDLFAKAGPAGTEYTKLGEKLRDASIKIGDALSGIVSGVLGLLPDSNTLAEGLIGSLESVASWLTTNKDTIVNGIRDIFQGFKDFATSDTVTNILGFLKSIYDQLFTVNQETGYAGWEELAFSIGNVATAIGNVLKPLLEGLNIDLPSTKTFVGDLVNALNNFASWIEKNQGLLTYLVGIIIGFLVVQLVTSLFWSFVSSLVSLAMAATAFYVAGIAMVAIIAAIIVVVGVVVAAFFAAKNAYEQLTATIKYSTELISLWFNMMKDNIVKTWDRIVSSAKEKDWSGIGWAIVQGIANGVAINVGFLITAVRNAAISAYNAAKAALGIQSPSTLFAGIGENLMAGMAEGILNSTGVAVAAMQSAVSAVSMPAISMQASQAAPSSISSTYQTSVVNNLTINSNAQSEQVAADFAMMSSLAGV